MKISEVQIYPIKPVDGLVGFASVVVDDSLYLGSIGVYKKLGSEGYRITYPTKRVGVRNLEIYHPISQEAGKAISDAILKHAERLLG